MFLTFSHKSPRQAGGRHTNGDDIYWCILASASSVKLMQPDGRRWQHCRVATGMRVLQSKCIYSDGRSDILAASEIRPSSALACVVLLICHIANRVRGRSFWLSARMQIVAMFTARNLIGKSCSLRCLLCGTCWWRRRGPMQHPPRVVPFAPLITIRVLSSASRALANHTHTHTHTSCT